VNKNDGQVAARCRSGRATGAARPRNSSARECRAHVAAVALIDLAVVVAHAARVNLHHQPVFQAHLRHLGQHLRAEEFLLRGSALPREHAAKSSAASAWGRSAVCAVGWPWSVAVQPSARKRARALRSAFR
jgi:hypothetical protein